MDRDELLINYVEQNPHLFSKQDKNYKNDQMKDNTWLHIGQMLNMDGMYVNPVKINFRVSIFSFID